MSMSIRTLLEAAEYLERREREAEHGYASTMPVPADLSRRRPKTKKAQGSRSTHNELEKNRRAHLRHCLDKLKEMVPLGPDASRHTTLGLLNNAKSFIKMLEEKDRKNQTTKDQLRREQRFLKRRLCNLDGAYGEERRSASESGSSSRSSASETDEVDIMGFNTNQSDSDDHSSIQSVTSDGGVAISTKRLCLAEGV
ncbi:max dimerization protein 1 [Ixodes scapularis]|uniref:max dimerization protein 1 n=1 Tax=Ixodes scapularis TaxID=6945 RepID=UPI001A9DC12C|nr:max dimerization protein 1 [Ixodes scapularis]